jgi:transcriptional regulator NrdR family protein
MRCTVCREAEIEYIDTYETETYDDRRIERCVGYCPNCNASFEWEEWFDFVGQENLTLIKED